MFFLCLSSAFELFSSLNESGQIAFVFSYNGDIKLKEISTAENLKYYVLLDSLAKLSQFQTGAEVAPTVITVKNGNFLYYNIYNDLKSEKIKEDLTNHFN
jgi:hypothetical protein